MSASLSPESVPPSGPFTSKEASVPGEESAELDHMEAGNEASDLVNSLQTEQKGLCSVGLPVDSD